MPDERKGGVLIQPDFFNTLLKGLQDKPKIQEAVRNQLIEAGISAGMLMTPDEIERRVREMCRNRDLFLAEVQKAGGPIDRIGDFIEQCTESEIDHFIEDIGPKVGNMLKEFWVGTQAHHPEY
jgi:hypothetical protein